LIGTKTPFRMSFIGGGSDVKEFYAHTPGCVLSTTIDKYMYIFIHPFFDDRIQVKYSKTELVDHFKDIKHPIAREVLSKFKLKGLDINSIADIPAGTGLGSSSSYTVGLFHALYSYTNKSVSAEILAREACDLEIEVLNEPIGKQDQYAASYGGLNIIQFLPTGKVRVQPLEIEDEIYKNLEDNLILFYTGKTRNAAEVLNDQKNNLANEKEKHDTLIQMTSLVQKAATCLTSGNLEGFGEVLDQNWQLKKSLSRKISGTNIDDLYALAKGNGALGGKLLGAGGGGFLLFYCEPARQERLRSALRKLKEVKFCFENEGSKIILNGH
jgi:D-glycero-alpha-D-manno-heptose-7-phosphate kinase